MSTSTNFSSNETDISGAYTDLAGPSWMLEKQPETSWRQRRINVLDVLTMNAAFKRNDLWLKINGHKEVIKACQEELKTITDRDRNIEVRQELERHFDENKELFERLKAHNRQTRSWESELARLIQEEGMK